MSENASLTVYSTTWCGPCRRLKGLLDLEGIPYTAVDIDADPEGLEWVKSVNRGNAVVPTVRFADGTALTNPSVAAVRAQLAATA
ncbi:MAG: mycoredoxin [Sporichthyaceae bacterium]